MRSIAIAILIPLVLLLALAGPPFYALLAYVWYGFFRPQEWVYVDITGYSVSLILGLILVLKSTLSGVFPTFRHPITIGIVAFLVAALLAQVNAVSPAVGWEWVDYFARLTLLCLLTVSLVDTQRKLYILALVIALSLGFHTSKAGVMAMVTGGTIGQGYGGAFPDNNGFALAAAMLIPLLFALARSFPSEWPFRSVAVLGLYLAAFGNALTVVWTFSRGGLLAMTTAIFVLLLLQRGRRLKLLFVIGAVAITATLLIDLPTGYTDRIETITTYEDIAEESALSRLHFWGTAVDMVFDHPLGIGIQNFSYAYDAYDTSNGRYGRSRPVHSAHFQVLAELGLIGFAVWTGLFLIALRYCLKLNRPLTQESALASTSWDPVPHLAAGLLASIMAFLVGGAFGNLAYNDLTWLTFALVAALDKVSKREGAMGMIRSPST